MGDSPALLRAGERETWPAALTGRRRVHRHFEVTRATAGGSPRGGASRQTPENNFRSPYDAARATSTGREAENRLARAIHALTATELKIQK